MRVPLSKHFGRRRLSSFQFSRMLPNMTTLSALCVGLSAVRFALEGKITLAVLAIIIAAILDTLDGRIARYLGASSHFGAELDSLSDAICFGAAPALVLYIFSLHLLPQMGWGVCLFFVACQALRLARFNTLNIATTEESSWKKCYFTGVPAPAGAMIALIPLLFGFTFDIDMQRYAVLQSAFMLLSALLLVSKIPTFSLKGRQVKPSHILPMMLCFALFIVTLVTHPWLALLLFWISYLGSIPFSVWAYRHDQKAAHVTGHSSSKTR